MVQSNICIFQLVKLWTLSDLIYPRPSQTELKSLTVNYSVGTHYMKFHFSLLSRLWFNAVHSPHMYDHKCIVLFTLPFHFQLNTKSQNGAFHFKSFSDFLFDLQVMSPRNDLKLVTVWLTVHYKYTLIFHILHISTLRCPDLVKWLKHGLLCSPEVHGYFPIGRPCGSQSLSVMKSISGKVICSVCSVIADKQKVFDLSPYTIQLVCLLKSRHQRVRLLVAVRETSVFFQSIPQERATVICLWPFSLSEMFNFHGIMALVLWVNSHY